MNYILIIAVAVLWGIADFLRKLSSGSTNDQLLSFIFNFGATLSPLVILAFLIYRKFPIKYNSSHLILSLFGGGISGNWRYISFLSFIKRTKYFNHISFD